MNIRQNAVKSKYNITKTCNNPVAIKNLNNSLSLLFNSSSVDIQIYKILNTLKKPVKTEINIKVLHKQSNALKHELSNPSNL